MTFGETMVATPFVPVEPLAVTGPEFGISQVPTTVAFVKAEESDDATVTVAVPRALLPFSGLTTTTID